MSHVCVVAGNYWIWVLSTTDEVYFIVDHLKHLMSLGVSDGKYQKSATELGFNHDPDGVLLDVRLRNLFLPVKHQLIDWMHTWCQDGVANVEAAMLLRNMAELRPSINNDMVQICLNTCVLPSDHGKINGKWVEPKRLRGVYLTAFASMVLSLVLCLYLFLDLFGVKKLLPEKYTCFKLMHQVIGLLLNLMKFFQALPRREVVPRQSGSLNLIRPTSLMPVPCFPCGRCIFLLRFYVVLGPTRSES